MKENELRIGNYVYPDKTSIEYIKVIAQDLLNTKFLEPILLTEEWLLKFGFEDNEYTFDLIANKKKLSFTWSSRIVSTGYRKGLSMKKYRHIEYVHQLQNLYFALTNKELTIQ